MKPSLSNLGRAERSGPSFGQSGCGRPSGSRGRVGVFGREGVVGGAQWVKWVFWPRGCCGRDAVGRVGLAAGNSAVLLIVPTLAK